MLTRTKTIALLIALVLIFLQHHNVIAVPIPAGVESQDPEVHCRCNFQPGYRLTDCYDVPFNTLSAMQSRQESSRSEHFTILVDCHLNLIQFVPVLTQRMGGNPWRLSVQGLTRVTGLGMCLYCSRKSAFIFHQDV